MITAPLALWPIYVKLLHSLIERYIHHRSRLGMKHVCETHTLAEECGGAGKEVHAEIDDDVNPGAETEDTVTLKVEGDAFSIRRHELEEKSRVFRDMFTLPLERSNTNTEIARESTISLEGVSLKRFQCFWRILQPKRHPRRLAKLTKDELVHALDLADMWDVPTVQEEAIRRIALLFTPSDALQKIQLGRRFNKPDWILSGHFDLVWRNDPLTPEEGLELGMDTVAQLAHAREMRIASEYTKRAYAWGYNEGGARLKWCDQSHRLVEEKLKRFVQDIVKTPCCTE